MLYVCPGLLTMIVLVIVRPYAGKLGTDESPVLSLSGIGRGRQMARIWGAECPKGELYWEKAAKTDSSGSLHSVLLRFFVVYTMSACLWENYSKLEKEPLGENSQNSPWWSQEMKILIVCVLTMGRAKALIIHKVYIWQNTQLLGRGGGKVFP